MRPREYEAAKFDKELLLVRESGCVRREESVPWPEVLHGREEVTDERAPNFGRDDEARRRDGYDKIYEVCWLNVFGPKLVETVGRERMLSTPAHRVEELPDEG